MIIIKLSMKKLKNSSKYAIQFLYMIAASIPSEGLVAIFNINIFLKCYLLALL